MTYKTVFQKTLSTKVGVYVKDLIDIHTKKEYLDAKEKIEKKIKKIAIFISDEGYGHSVRQKAIISEFLKYNPKIEFTIFNNKRLLFLKEYLK